MPDHAINVIRRDPLWCRFEPEVRVSTRNTDAQPGHWSGFNPMTGAWSRDWMICPQPNPAAALRLFGFPYSGGGVAIFHKWPALMPAHVELFAAQLPGRDGRRGEPPFDRMAPLVRALADVMPA